MAIPQLQKSVTLMRSFQEDLMRFEVELQRLWSEKKYTGNEWMAEPYPHTAMHELGPSILRVLGPLRSNIGRNTDEVTAILNSYDIPTIWTVHPPALIGGLVRSYNVFHAFVDLEIQKDARPTFLQIQDCVSKAIWRAEKQIEELTLNPPSPVSKLSAVPRWIHAALSWLFPTEKQRGVLGWIIIGGIVAVILRSLFGIRLEEIGKLLTKVFK
jgi:hypothetical protein